MRRAIGRVLYWLMQPVVEAKQAALLDEVAKHYASLTELEAAGRTWL